MHPPPRAPSGDPPAAPHDAFAHAALAAACRAAGDELGALAHEVAQRALTSHRAGAMAAALADLDTVATGYFMKGDHRAAAYWYRLLLALDANHATAHLNLAAIHDAQGEHGEAARCRARAYALQRVFVEPVDAPLRRLLILCAGGAAANVPFESLLAGSRTLRIKYIIDRADRAEDAALPAYDAVFNAIGDADAAVPLAQRLQDFAAACARPLLNAPAAVARTQRQRLGELLGGLADVHVAPCVRHEAPAPALSALGERLEAAGLSLPVLVRPAGSHGGQGLVRCESLQALQAAQDAIGGPHYLSAFVDTRGTDGWYRKARVVFVGGEPLPYHLAISPHWMVHYQRAGMTEDRRRLDEEAAFLADPGAALGARAMAAIAAIGQRVDLDYAGVDFTARPDGGVLVFEANATMLVHRERPGGPLAHKNPHVERIAAAFERLLSRAAGC